jgi:hypothetical protein
MTITIVTSELQAEFLKNCNSVGIKSVSYEKQLNDEFYDTTIEFKDYCDFDLIAQIIFGAGISYGLDLKYSSYDNNIPR